MTAVRTGQPIGMGDYQHSESVDAPAQQLFDYLADVRNLPKYFQSMTSAEPAEGEAVHVVADVEGTKRESEAWFRVDRDNQRLEWGSEGDSSYCGSLDVTGDDTRSTVELSLHTERVDADRIEQGVRQTLENVKSLVEQGSAPQS